MSVFSIFSSFSFSGLASYFFSGRWLFLVSAVRVRPFLTNKRVPDHLRNHSSLSFMFFSIHFFKNNKIINLANIENLGHIWELGLSELSIHELLSVIFLKYIYKEIPLRKDDSLELHPVAINILCRDLLQRIPLSVYFVSLPAVH